MENESVQKISWQPDFATGVGIIDDQHRVLINMLNDAGAKLTDRSPIEDYAHIVQGLLSYAGYHFQTEERLMTEHGYDTGPSAQAADHVEQHRGFAEKVVAVQEQIKAGQRIPKKDLIDFLTGWLTDHILTIDRKFGAFICEKKAGPG